MFRFLKRIASFFERYFIACENFGFLNATKIFSISRLRATLTSIYIKKIDKHFFFRSNKDIGVMSHFWKPLFIIENTIKTDDLHIVDAGANIGDETARFRYFHPTAKIIAIEAEAENFSILKKNFERDANVSLIHAALWSEKTTLNLMPDNGSPQSFSVSLDSAKKNLGSIGTITIEEIMKKNHWSHIDILKLDIEGAENELFSNHYESWIDRINVIIFEIPDYDSPGTTQKIFHAIRNISFNCYRADETLVFIKKNTPFSLRVSAYY